ncbi:H-2 class II histocompatibility antigen, E-S beta chain-like [Mustela putorius furo]|uniref:H-2 class II histocompatibility antigen, E-S beta chain-like n=1 Tax=Mustela putorius furo TaxID=9669 RepID=A0A8U0RWZ5_MUSPF|nr:H-2 class II histocompatibility antigen, E-S beta chain-like [Mustela putorius furo]
MAGERAVGGEEGGRCLSAIGVQEEAVRVKCQAGGPPPSPGPSGRLSRRPQREDGRYVLVVGGARGASEGAAVSVFREPAGDRIVSVPTAHFLLLVKSECHYCNGTERVRLRIGISTTAKSRWRTCASTATWGSSAGDRAGAARRSVLEQPEGLHGAEEVRGAHRVQTQLRVEPIVTVYPGMTQSLKHHNLLISSVNGFYPGHIEVRWFWNGQEEESGVVSTGPIRNGDWTFQTLVMLETVPQSGEVYTCQVEHPSLMSPVTMEWRTQSDSAQSKLLSGTGGFVLGLLFLVVGLFIYFRNQKGHSGLQPTGLLS